MTKLNYNIYTIDLEERQHACWFCDCCVYDITMGHYCTKLNDTIGENPMFPNDCTNFKNTTSEGNCRSFANKIKSNLKKAKMMRESKQLELF